MKYLMFTDLISSEFSTNCFSKIYAALKREPFACRLRDSKDEWE